MQVTLGTEGLVQFDARQGVIRSPAMRGTLPGSSGREAHLGFQLLGPSETQVPSASGQILCQVGTKLCARDSCNTLYIMVRGLLTNPQQELVILLKRNITMTTDAECGNSGYSTV